MAKRVDRKNKNLMNLLYRASLLISMSTIILVQTVSFLAIIVLMAGDFNRSADKSADEIAKILIEPLYNVDDGQAVRIGQALLSSGRISGIKIYSTASGEIMDIKPDRALGIVPPRSRTILYKLANLGRVELYFGEGDIVSTGVFFLGLMFCVVVAVLAGSFLANKYFVQKRVGEVFAGFSYGISRIAGGQYDRPMRETGYLDIDAIITMINGMAAHIHTKNTQILGMNKLLEQRVGERTAELESAIAEQRMLQDRLIEAGKLSALGQLAAGIAHELNTPLGAIYSSGRILCDFLDEKFISQIVFLPTLDKREMALYGAVIALGVRENRNLNIPLPSRAAVRDAAKILEAAGVSDPEEIAGHLCDNGLSSAVGELVPLMGTSRDLDIVASACEPIVARRMALVVNESAEKAAGVVGALRSYLSKDEPEKNQVVDVSGDITKVLTLMHNMLKHGINVKAELSPARVLGSSDKLSQVWMNLIRNAAQAMEFRGELLVRSEEIEGVILVSVADTGPGISESIRGRIFEPFFTTKKHGDGMGLGLDICKKIVEAHHGTISFESRPGKTVFTVAIPALRETDEARAVEP